VIGQVRPSTEADHVAIVSFLCDIFGESEGESEAFSSVQADQVQWKFSVPRGDYKGDRSWVIEHNGELIAHGGVWPLWILTVEGETAGLHVIDWAGKPGAAGAGAFLMRQLGRLGTFTCAAGGSKDAEKILPLLGFRVAHQLTLWARPARPLKQALTHQQRDARLPARWARNTYWRYWPPLGPSWQVEEVVPEEFPEALWPHPEPYLAVFRRSSALFRYLAGCRSARIRLYRAVGRRTEGYFCLSRVPGVAKIIDAWTPSAAVEDWVALYASAFRKALADPEVCEVVTLAGIARANQALHRTGFRPRDVMSLMLNGKSRLIQPGREFHFQMVDNDKGFRHIGRADYVT